MEPKRTNCETCPYQLESHKEYIDYPVYYCIGKGQKNARRLKKKDRGAFPPDWCPRHLEPPKLRIYTPAGRKHAVDRFDRHTWYSPNPSSLQYTLRMEMDSPVSAYNLYQSVMGLLEWRSVWLEDFRELVGTEVQDEDVLEVDDGIRPTFFYLDTRMDEVFTMVDFNAQYIRR